MNLTSHFETAKLFEAVGDDYVLLSAENCPAISGPVTCSSIRATVVDRCYDDSLLIERIVLELDELACVSLGLLIFSTLFNPSHLDAVVNLDGDGIKRLAVRFELPDAGFSGLVQLPKAYGFWPERLDEFPFEQSVPPTELPLVQYRLGTDELLTRETLSRRDMVRIGGGASALAELGSVLLSLGLRNASGDRITLECEAGWRGVAPGSQELQLIRL